MGKKKHIGRKRAPTKQASVLIVKPHNIQYQTDERCSQWIMQAFQRGIAEPLSIATKIPELCRNWSIEQFLTNPDHAKKTHIFFIDADTVPINLFAIEALMRHNKPVVAGVTPIIRKAEEIRCMWSVIIEDHDEPDGLGLIGIDDLPKKLFKAELVGGTTLLVRRDVLEKLEPPYQKCKFNDKMTEQIRSEDYFFCDKIREAGYTIFVDPDVVCHHYHISDHLDIFAAYRAGIEEGRKRRLGT